MQVVSSKTLTSLETYFVPSTLRVKQEDTTLSKIGKYIATPFTAIPYALFVVCKKIGSAVLDFFSNCCCIKSGSSEQPSSPKNTPKDESTPSNISQPKIPGNLGHFSDSAEINPVVWWSDSADETKDIPRSTTSSHRSPFDAATDNEQLFTPLSPSTMRLLSTQTSQRAHLSML